MHVGTADTLSFVVANAKPQASLLEVGCGDGELAKALQHHGFKVTAIDKRLEAVEASRKIGVPAIEVDFLEFEPGTTYDVILFSRSLHHIHPLDAAVQQAAKLLAKDGVLLLEDFGADWMDEHTAVWFFGLKAFLAASGNPLKGHGPKLDSGQMPAHPEHIWYEHHFTKHSLSTSKQMRESIQSHFVIASEERVPYLYRYFCDDVEEAQLKQIFLWEQALVNICAIINLGLRFVAKPAR
jgi:SAM-dependent methyltransferase